MSYGINISGNTSLTSSSSLYDSLLANDPANYDDEEEQISELVQNAQSNGTSASDLLAEIDTTVDQSQPSDLYQYLDGASTSTSAYTSYGEATTSTTPSYVNTSA